MKKESGKISKSPEIKVVLLGIGAMGISIAKLLLKKKGLKIVGAIDKAPDKVGKDLGEVLGTGAPMGVIVSNDASETLSKVKPDIAVHATSSFLKDVLPQLKDLVQKGVNVVSTCEELSYPYVSDPNSAAELDRLAKKQDVTVLGTGINPGFLMDTLAITLTGVCQEVNTIRIERIMNASTRRVPFQKKIGAGLAVEEFREKMEKKVITGHVGLEQSIAMIASALRWNLDRIIIGPIRPVVADSSVESDAIKVKSGQAAGLGQSAYGIMNEKPVITLDFQAYIGAKEEYDSVTIDGIPPIHEKISPCVHGDFGTAAVIANSIPKVMNAPPGLKTMKDLPIPSAALEDMRLYLE